MSIFKCWWTSFYLVYIIEITKDILVSIGSMFRYIFTNIELFHVQNWKKRPYFKLFQYFKMKRRYFQDINEMYGLIWSGQVWGGFSKYKLECYFSTSNKSWRY